MIVTWAPGCLPYSAPYVSLSILNSRTASTPSICPLTPPGCMLFSAAPVYSIPLSKNMFCCGLFPATENMFAAVELETPIPPVFSDVKMTTPGLSVMSWS